MFGRHSSQLESDKRLQMKSIITAMFVKCVMCLCGIKGVKLDIMRMIRGLLLSGRVKSAILNLFCKKLIDF